MGSMDSILGIKGLVAGEEEVRPVVGHGQCSMGEYRRSAVGRMDNSRCP